MATLAFDRRAATVWASQLVIAAGCILLPGCTIDRPPDGNAAGTSQAAAAPSVESDRRTIVGLERDWAAALVRKDVAWYSRHAATDFRTILSGGGVISRAEVIEHVRNSPPAKNLELEQSDVRIYGDAAIATVTQSFERANGQVARLRITDVWVRSETGRWMVVQSHETSLAAGQPGRPAN